MEEEFKALINMYGNIKKSNWVCSTRKGPTGVGKTFEDLIGKEEETFCFPDFLGIEIKTKRSNTREPYGLFCAEPDGENLFETERIRTNYGYPSKKYPQFTVFNHTIKIGKKTISGNYQFTLEIDYEKECVYLVVLDKNQKIIDKQTYWSFSLLKERLERKLNYLAVIKAHSKFQENAEYFKYYRMYIFKKVNFNNFLNLLEKGKIFINFKIGVYTGEYRYGCPHNRGTSFSLYEESIAELYENSYVVGDGLDQKEIKKLPYI